MVQICIQKARQGSVAGGKFLRVDTVLDDNSPPRGDAFVFSWQIDGRASAVPSATRTTIRLC